VVRRPDGSDEDLVRLTPEISKQQPSAQPDKEVAEDSAPNNRVIDGRVKKKRKNRKRKKNKTGNPAT